MNKKEYRTSKQFQKILISITNGNWTQGAEKCIEYGFFANDLVKALQEYNNELDYEQNHLMADIALLVEKAAKLRK